MSARERRTPLERGPRGAGRDRHRRRARHALRGGPAAGLAPRPGRRPSRPAPDLFELVERVRRRAIALRQDDDPEERRRLDEDLADLDLGSAEAVIEAFALYFQLVNLAEARGRVRALRRRERAARDGVLDDSVAEAVVGLRRGGADEDRLDELLARPVDRAGADRPPDGGPPADRAGRAAPLRRAAGAAGRPAAHARPRIARSAAGCARRSRSCGAPPTCAPSRPTPLDEVRTAMAFFDATLFTVVPRLYRALDGALDPPTPASRRGLGAALGLRPDRDATAAGRAVPALGELDRRRPRRQSRGDRRRDRADAADPGRARAPRLRGRRHAADADARGGGVGRPRRARRWRSRLARDAEALPETDRLLRRRFPDEPYRQRFGFIAERLRRTRAALTGEAAPISGRYADAAELDAELAEVQDALVADRLERVAFGRGRRPALAARHVRVPPRLARGPPARRRPPGRARGAARRGDRPRRGRRRTCRSTR